MKAANRHHEEVVALGLGAYDLTLRKVHKKVELSQLATHAQRSYSTADKRSIGRVLFADPIGISSKGPNGFTLDWAVIGIKKDAFGGDFEGTMLYLGTFP